MTDLKLKLIGLNQYQVKIKINNLTVKIKNNLIILVLEIVY